VRSDLPAISNPAITDAEYAAFINDANDFGLGLHQRVASDLSLATRNSVFSPTSAQLALGMTYAGAAGDTAAAIKTVLHDNLGSTKYHAGCNRLERDLASRAYSRTDANNNTYRIELTPSNSLWADRTVSINSSFLDLLSTQYDSGMWQADFIGQPDPSRLAINAWVSDRTHDRIKDLLMPGDVASDTRFVLVNALYFYGTWGSLFDKNTTAAATFHTLGGTDVAADTMEQTLTVNYKATSTYEVLQLPYVQGDLWMTLVLPSNGAFEAVRSQVSGAWLQDATSSLTATGIQISLPKFKIETPQMPLTQSLQALGMSIAFGPYADFSGISIVDPVAISRVIQKAFIGVDEDGTEAAAATAVVLDGLAIVKDPIPVAFDRPFLFFIQDKTGLALFAGHVVDPTQ
jgi:serpin B